MRNGVCLVYVFGKHSCCKAISCVVCSLNNLIDITEFDYLLNWTKNLQCKRKKKNYLKSLRTLQNDTTLNRTYFDKFKSIQSSSDPGHVTLFKVVVRIACLDDFKSYLLTVWPFLPLVPGVLPNIKYIGMCHWKGRVFEQFSLG